MRALTHALEHKRLHHAYLFTGTRGVGKTTLSRILAKSLNCRGADGNGDITATPCGVCEACVAIDAGRFVDYIEMDAASNRGVDEMAQLLEQAVYAPSNARFKVYMIDEVHMLTNHAFNSMLKTLEEPPEHVKFILATTDPQKIPVTVLSRCLQFNLKQMPPGHIIGHLEHILGEERIECETPALRLVAQAAHGSMRDALSLTDQAIAYAAGKITLDAVQGMLGALDQSYLVRLLDALGDNDGSALIAVADDMAARSLSYGNALQDLATLLHHIALAHSAPAALPDDLPEREHVLRLAERFDGQVVQLLYQIAVHGRNELGLAPDEYAGFTMTLLRMLAFRPDFAEHAPRDQAVQAAPAATGGSSPAVVPSVAQTAARLSTGGGPARAALDAMRARSQQGARAGGNDRQEDVATDMAPNLQSASEADGSVQRVAAQSEKIETMSKTLEATAPFDAFDARQSETAANAEAAKVIDTAQSTTAAPSSVPWQATQQVPNQVQHVQTGPGAQADVLAGDSSATWDGNWPRLAASLPVRGVAQQLAQQSELIELSQENGVMRCHLRVPLETLLSAGSCDKLAGALSAHFGVPVQVKHEIGVVQNTAHAEAVAEQANRQREAEETIKHDPFVQTVMREFGATIVPGSIRPV